MTQWLCPVCGYPGLRDQPWLDGAPSDEICPCCGTQFGYDDAVGGEGAARERRYVSLRKRWIESGCLWFSRATHQPDDWDPRRQLLVFE